ncbi:hypothetical protein DACRYDRAFT_110146 [Dacryopinax primogenitus]|uniref:Uncharacterized protein n=1 Tax=Dacryopinax primogenitus (strain DJM 731) TaxID=1858805 RepID=M5FV22_DACPD|nr:uncharacterized protein DACRYDRAFT_110146 [Dacryopinax primogenitus]EJT99424.1 hypothetical protein DACRYDRAFT_110146 [Dacryopinax primogenitus]
MSTIDNADWFVIPESLDYLLTQLDIDLIPQLDSTKPLLNTTFKKCCPPSYARRQRQEDFNNALEDHILTMYEQWEILLCWQMYCREFIFQKGITYLESCMVPERQVSALSMMYDAFQYHVEAKSALPNLLAVFPILEQMAAK